MKDQDKNVPQIEDPGDLTFFEPYTNNEFSIRKNEIDNTWTLSGNITLNIFELDGIRDYLNKVYEYEKTISQKIH